MGRRSFQDTPLAVIGMACRLPGANNLDEFWRLLCKRESAIAELPPERLDQKLYYDPRKAIPGRTYSKLGGRVPDKPFDRNLCPVPETLIAASDSVSLTMLEVAATACRHAGLDPMALPLRNTGVYIGHARGGVLVGELGYATHIEEIVQQLSAVDAFARLTPIVRDQITRSVVSEVERMSPHRTHGFNPDLTANAVAGLISEAFALTGPYMAVDAACAASLYALNLAAYALHRGQIDMAIVGGASHSNWYSLVIFSQAQALSAKGSFPFDARADGFISSDGYGAVLIKTLPKALADGDRILGTIRGIGVSCDGRGKSLWAPRKEGQIEAVQRAYFPGLDPARLQCIEAHGTSTQLGDATEVEALSEAFAGLLAPGAQIPISSVKANIGHSREAAGISGLIKILLCMTHGIIPAAANFETPNPEIPWDKIPFFVPTKNIDWPEPSDGEPRRAGIDSFGIGGLNVHVVIDNVPAQSQKAVFVPACSAPQITEDDDAVAVIGLGAILPGARTAAAYWELLSSGRDPKDEIPATRWNADLLLKENSYLASLITTRTGGFVTEFSYDWKKHKIPPRQLETADPLQFMLLDAADQALRDAGYAGKPLDGRRAGVIVGTCFGGDFARQLNIAMRLPQFQETLARTMRQASLDEAAIEPVIDAVAEAFMRWHHCIHDETGSYTSSTLASRIAKTYDLMGGAFAVDAGEASSFAALGAALEMLRAGTLDWALCAGAQRNMDICAYEVYALDGRLASGRPRSALDAEADGFVPGEGVGMIVLKRLKDARRDGDPIRAIIRAVAAGTQARDPKEAMRLGIERALNASALTPGDVRVVETAGLGVAALDAAEAEALDEIYGSTERKQPLLLGSVIGQIGHTQGASGMASLLKLILGFQNRRLPGSTPAAQKSILDDSSTLKALAEPLALSSETDSRFCTGVSAYALRGSAYHAIVERPLLPAPASTLARESWSIIRFVAEQPSALVELLKSAEPNAGALLTAAPTREFTAAQRVRLAIVADGADSLSRKLQLAQKQILNPAARAVLEEQGIFYRELGAEPARVALLFAGQGSQYPGMLRELTETIPAAAAMTQQIDATLRQLGYPSFGEIAWRTDANLSADVWLAQLSVLLADLIVYAALKDIGVRADVVAAHSYGEYPALVAAGSWGLEQAIRVTRARCDAIEASRMAEGVMLSTGAPCAVVQRLLESMDSELFIANFNAPDQTVVGGKEKAAAELSARLSSEGFEARRLPVPRPFHTPLMAEVKEPMRAALEREKIFPPRMALLSSVTNRYMSDPMELRDNLVEQLTTPVRYVDLVERLAADGVNVFIEVGPRQVLTALHRRILGERGLAVIACDNPKRQGTEQFHRVRALLECAGVLTGATMIEAETRRGAAVARRAQGKRAILHFDATVKRRERMRRAGEESKIEVSAAHRDAPGGPADELESVLVNFVCEHTGYPPDIVDLDADLEADLGIDSIKKARLLGELRERFKVAVQPGVQLSLDDYPTLRHILNFLRQSATDAPPAAAAGQALQEVFHPSVGAVSPVRAEPDRSSPPQDTLATLRLRGTPYEIGVAHARSQGERIQNILRRYGDHLPGEIKELEELKEALCHRELFFSAAGLEELQGMADELRRPMEHLMAYNFGLYPPQLGGCAQFAITARANGNAEMLHGANEDSPLALSLPGCLTRIVQARHPAGKIPHVIFGVSGQLGGLNGINGRGLAVTSTMLLDRRHETSRTPGRLNPVLVKTLLEEAENVDQAVDIVKQAKKNGAWSLCLSHHATDRLCYLEYDGDSLQLQSDTTTVVTTNHCVLFSPTHEVPEHSRHRLQRLQVLLGENGRSRYMLEQAQAALRDRFDLGRDRPTPHPTMNTVQRLDNQMSLVMRPAQGELWTTPGPLAQDRANHYFKLDLAELLNGRAHAASTAVVSDENRMMSRFVLRTTDAPLQGNRAALPRLHGPVLILGDNPSAQALRQRLRAGGAKVRDLPVDGGPEAALAALDGFWREEPAPHLFIMTACDPDAAPGDDEEAWNRRRSRGVMLPYLVCQRWMGLVGESKLLPKATLAAATGLGGDFGFSGGALAIEGGGLTGLLKSVRREFDGILVKVVDLPAQESPQAVAAALCGELAGAAPEVEVGYIRGRRRVVRAAPRPAVPLNEHQIARGSIWVITGGARGITAFVARTLGEKFGVKLHLIGKSPVPDRNSPLADSTTTPREAAKASEIQNTLRALAAAGVGANYHSCDVSDRQALRRVLEDIRHRDGPIYGIIHAAGVEAATRFDRKLPAKVAETIAAKVDGAAALMALTREDPLKYFVAFGSISGRFGGHGQTDYALASDMLCKMIGRFRTERPDCDAVAIHWPAWAEVGMAVRPEAKVLIEFSNLSFMPVREGIDHLIEELGTGTPEAEVLFLDRSGSLDLDNTLPGADQRQAYRRSQERITISPMIEGIHELAEGSSLVAEARLDPVADPFLRDHRFRSLPLLPSVITLEMFAESAATLTGGAADSFRRLEFVNGLRFYSSRAEAARVRAVLKGDFVECELRADFYNAQGKLIDPDRLYATGSVETTPSVGPLPVPPAGELPRQWHPIEYLDGARAQNFVFYGPTLRALEGIALEPDGAWGRIRTPSPAEAGGSRAGTWRVPAAVLDACLLTCGAFGRRVMQLFQLPEGFASLHFARLPEVGEICTVRAQFRERHEQNTFFDFTLFGADRTPIIRAQGVRFIAVSTKAESHG